MTETSTAKTVGNLQGKKNLPGFPDKYIEDKEKKRRKKCIGSKKRNSNFSV